MEAHDHVIVSN